MTSALEKAARACAHAYYSSDYEESQAQSLAGYEWPEWVDVARAVLMAVRDLDQGWVMKTEGLRLDDTEDFAFVIDAILNKETEK